MQPVERSWSPLGVPGGVLDEVRGADPAHTLPVWVAILTRTTRGHGVLRLVQSMGSYGVPAHPVRPAEFEAVVRRRVPAAAVLRVPSGGPPGELDTLAEMDSDICRIPWINNVASVVRVHDKLECVAQLEAAGLPVPPTTLVLRDVANDLDALPGTHLVVKPLRGAAGRGVTVGLGREEAIRSARAFADLTGSALVQTCLGDGVDRRMFIIDGAVVAGMERRPTAAGRASVLYGGETRPWIPNEAQSALGVRAADVLGLDVAGVDLLSDGGRDVILEVNACPGFAAIEATTGLDIADTLASAILSRCGLR